MFEKNGFWTSFYCGLEFDTSPLPELRVHRATHSFAITDFFNSVDCNAQNIDICSTFYRIYMMGNYVLRSVSTAELPSVWKTE